MNVYQENPRSWSLLYPNLIEHNDLSDDEESFDFVVDIVFDKYSSIVRDVLSWRPSTPNLWTSHHRYQSYLESFLYFKIRSFEINTKSR